MKIEVSGLRVILFVVLLVLKLTSVIAWSWWLVTLPLWWPVAIVIVGAILAFIFTVIFIKPSKW